MTSLLRKIFVATILVASLGACNERGIREVMDEESLVSVISMTPPFTLYRLTMGGDIEREFVSVGPVERIQSTQRGHYLWVNLWAVRRDGTHESLALYDTVTLETTDGEFDLTRVANDHTDLSLSKPVYRVVRSGDGEAYYELPEMRLDDLRDAPLIAVRIGATRYELWGDQTAAREALAEFIVETTGY